MHGAIQKMVQSVFWLLHSTSSSVTRVTGFTDRFDTFVNKFICIISVYLF